MTAGTSSMITVRRLAIEDAVECDRIVASLPYHFAHEEGRRLCADAVRSQDGFVAVESGRPVGFLTFVHWFHDAAEITWMAVQAERRREGIGSLLMDALVRHLRATDRKLLIVLTVSPDDDEDAPANGYPATRAFYSAMGFKLARNLAREWPSDLAVLMVRHL